MKLSSLMEGIHYNLYGEDCEIGCLQYDSRKVQPGDAFVCLKGQGTDGHDYAKSAVAKGAVAVISEKKLEDIPATVAVVADTRNTMALLAKKLSHHACEHMKIIGVTGTNGKTTTTYMIKTILENCGYKTGLIGTIANYAGSQRLEATMTTPEPGVLHGLFAQMLENDCVYVAMEVSSHALSQERVAGIQFETAVFSNLTQDHLDYHGNMQAYAAEKKKLFLQSKHAVINLDDSYAGYMIKDLQCPILTYGIETEADIRASKIETHRDSVCYQMHYQGKIYEISVCIPGRFTVYNSLAAISACITLGIPLEKIIAGVRCITGVPGRAEVVPTPGKDFTVLLDYSHTPDGLQNILTTAREFTKGRLITVFGCGGDRDHTKRPKMGKIAGMFSDYCVVTSDNPRTEDPMQIIEMILPGMEESGCKYTVIENRKDAIAHALVCAQKDDVIILAGKGHEPYQEIQGVRYPFDEKEIVQEVLLG